MATICPTVTAYDADDFIKELSTAASVAERIHIDLMDGMFAPTKSPRLSDITLPKDRLIDIHLMFADVESQLPGLIALKPHMVIIHAETHNRNDLAKFAALLRSNAIRCGIAYLPETPIEETAYLLPHMQHALVFSGKLGYHGGSADLHLLSKVSALKQAHRYLEIGWDGGIDNSNAAQLESSGVDVLNVGGFIQNAVDPKAAYATLLSVS